MMCPKILTLIWKKSHPLFPHPAPESWGERELGVCVGPWGEVPSLGLSEGLAWTAEKPIDRPLVSPPRKAREAPPTRGPSCGPAPPRPRPSEEPHGLAHLSPEAPPLLGPAHQRPRPSAVPRPP